MNSLKRILIGLIIKIIVYFGLISVFYKINGSKNGCYVKKWIKKNKKLRLNIDFVTSL